MITNVNAVTLAMHDMAKSITFYPALGSDLKYGAQNASFAGFHAGVGHLNLAAVPVGKVWSGGAARSSTSATSMLSVPAR